MDPDESSGGAMELGAPCGDGLRICFYSLVRRLDAHLGAGGVFAATLLDRLIDPDGGYAGVEAAQWAPTPQSAERHATAAAVALEREGQADVGGRVMDTAQELLRRSGAGLWVEAPEPRAACGVPSDVICGGAGRYRVAPEAVERMVAVLCLLRRPAEPPATLREALRRRHGEPAGVPRLRIAMGRPGSIVPAEAGWLEERRAAAGKHGIFRPPLQEPRRAAPRPQLPPEPPRWLQWLSAEPAADRPADHGEAYDAAKQSAVQVCRMYPGGSVTLISEESAVAAALDCISGRSGALFPTTETGDFALTDRLVTVPGGTPGLLRARLQPCAELGTRLRKLQLAAAAAAAGPSLTFAGLGRCVEAAVTSWRAEALRAQCRTLLALSQATARFAPDAALAEQLLVRAPRPSPCGLIGLLYAELGRAAAQERAGSERVLEWRLSLFRAVLGPLLRALSALMHGSEPGPELAVRPRTLTWEGETLPAWLKEVGEHAAAAHANVGDVRRLAPLHPVTQPGGRPPAPCPAQQGSCVGGVRFGSGGLLARVTAAAGGRPPAAEEPGARPGAGWGRAPPLPAPLSAAELGLTVGAAQRTARHIAEVADTRQRRAEAEQRGAAELRARVEQERAARSAAAAARRVIPLPADWPGSLRYRSPPRRPRPERPQWPPPPAAAAPAAGPVPHPLGEPAAADPELLAAARRQVEDEYRAKIAEAERRRLLAQGASPADAATRAENEAARAVAAGAASALPPLPPPAAAGPAAAPPPPPGEIAAAALRRGRRVLHAAKSPRAGQKAAAAQHDPASALYSLARTDLDNMTVESLRATCIAAGLPAAGRKALLAGRLRRWLRNRPDPDAAQAPAGAAPPPARAAESPAEAAAPAVAVFESLAKADPPAWHHSRHSAVLMGEAYASPAPALRRSTAAVGTREHQVHTHTVQLGGDDPRERWEHPEAHPAPPPPPAGGRGQRPKRKRGPGATPQGRGPPAKVARRGDRTAAASVRVGPVTLPQPQQEAEGALYRWGPAAVPQAPAPPGEEYDSPSDWEDGEAPFRPPPGTASAPVPPRTPSPPRAPSPPPQEPPAAPAPESCVERLHTLLDRVRREYGPSRAEGAAATPAAPTRPAQQPQQQQQWHVRAPHAAGRSMWMLQQLRSADWRLARPEDIPAMHADERLPPNLAVAATLRRAAEAQRTAVAEAVRGMVLHSAGLTQHTAWLLAVFLASDGGFVDNVVHVLEAAATKTKSHYAAQDELAAALRALRPQLPQGSLADAGVATHFRAQVEREVGDLFSGRGSVAPRLSAGKPHGAIVEDYFDIVYTPQEPLGRVISPEVLGSFRQAQRILVYLRRAVRSLTQGMRSICRPAGYNGIRHYGPNARGRLPPLVLKLSILRYDCQRFLQSLHDFAADGLRAAGRRLAAVLSDREHPLHPRSIEGYARIFATFAEGVRRHTWQMESMQLQLRHIRDAGKCALELPLLAELLESNLMPEQGMQRLHGMLQRVRTARQHLVSDLAALVQASGGGAEPELQGPNAGEWPVRREWARQLLLRLAPAPAEAQRPRGPAPA